ncbi:MAG: hypothetical protein WCO89_07655, partial [Syntrophus sp. (in: bacteria)]
PYLKRCVHCGILFFTDPRNINRQDLGCPFGCRRNYRKAMSAGRVKAYYQSEDGRRKKSWLNNASYQRRCSATYKNSEAAGIPPDKSLIIYIQILVTIIEGRRVSLAAINSLLQDFRQHSIDIWKRIGYRCSYTASRPP